MKDDPRFIERGNIAESRVGKLIQLDLAKKKSRTASKWIIAVGIIIALSGLIIFFIQKAAIADLGIDPTMSYEQEDGSIIMGDILLESANIGACILLVINVIMACVFIGLGIWARRSTIVPPIVALIIWITIQLIGAIIVPLSLFEGWFIKIFFIIALVAAVKAGLQARQIRREIQT